MPGARQRRSEGEVDVAAELLVDLALRSIDGLRTREAWAGGEPQGDADKTHLLISFKVYRFTVVDSAC